MDKPKTSNLTQDPQRTKLEQTPATTPAQPDAQTAAALLEQPAPKLVKIRAERDLVLLNGQSVRAGTEAMVSEAEAAAHCVSVKGTMIGRGYREGGDEPEFNTIVKAVRLS